jgi:MoxR-like ATPase
LIDEIDKSDIDLPNDLLHVFEEGRFEIPELIRAAAVQPRVRVLTHGGQGESGRVTIERGFVEAEAFPFVAITSNGERDLPPAFLRRCLRLDMPRPDAGRLRKIVEAHLGRVAGTEVDQLIQGFLEETENGRLLAVDQLLNAIFLVTSERIPGEQDWEEIRESLMRALDEE